MTKDGETVLLVIVYVIGKRLTAVTSLHGESFQPVGWKPIANSNASNVI